MAKCFLSFQQLEDVRCLQKLLGILSKEPSRRIRPFRWKPQELYNQRYIIEPTNAWIGSFRSLLNRFDTVVSSGKELNHLAFIVIAIKKFDKKKSK